MNERSESIASPTSSPCTISPAASDASTRSWTSLSILPEPGYQPVEVSNDLGTTVLPRGLAVLPLVETSPAAADGVPFDLVLRGTRGDQVLWAMGIAQGPPFPVDRVLDLDASSKSGLLRTLSAIAAKQLGIGEAAIFSALDNREKLGSTGIGEGIAIPHAAIPDLKKPFALFVRLSKPIDFEAIDENPVDIVAVLLVPAERSSENLNLLACLARVLRAPHKLERIRAASAIEDVYQSIIEGEG